MSRIIGYAYEALSDADRVDETPVERVLDKALKQGVVTQFDTGRGLGVWFNGKPGKALRAVRSQVLRLLPKNWQPVMQRKK
jgi:hypothetical protein